MDVCHNHSKPAQGADNSPLRLAGSNLRPHALCTDGDIAYTCIADHSSIAMRNLSFFLIFFDVF